MAGQQELKPLIERQFQTEEGGNGMIMRIYDPHLAVWWQQLEASTPLHNLGFPRPIAHNSKDTGMFNK